MSWDISLAKKIKRQARSVQAGASFSGIVQSVSPLVVSAYDGALMLQGDRIRVADTITEIQVGNTVCIVGNAPYTVVARF